MNFFTEIPIILKKTRIILQKNCIIIVKHCTSSLLSLSSQTYSFQFYCLPSNKPAFPDLLLCSVKLHIPCQQAAARRRAEVNRSLLCYFLTSRRALYIPLTRDTVSPSSPSTVTGAKFLETPLPTASTLKRRTLYLTTSSPCLLRPERIKLSGTED